MKNKNYNSKLKTLKIKLKKLKSVVVAYSGGVDSTFLLKAASSVLGRKNVLAVIAESETYPSGESTEAQKVAKKLKIPYKVIHTRELNTANFRKNPINRCYFCKKELFSELKKIAEKYKLNNIIDGSNFDDRRDWRPGSAAAKELKISSPLAEAGFTKRDIRFLSQRLRLPTWNKPSLACLASRIPYNSKITKDKLEMIDKAENFIKSLGFRQVRVRHYDRLARIEVEPREIERLINKRKKITKKFKEIGFIYITLDLAGYRTGSMNAGLSLRKVKESSEKVFHYNQRSLI